MLGVVPLLFADNLGYSQISQADKLEISISKMNNKLSLKNVSKNIEIPVKHTLSDNDIEIMKSGGRLAYIKSRQNRR